jgi:hypothetical protein
MVLELSFCASLDDNLLNLDGIWMAGFKPLELVLVVIHTNLVVGIWGSGKYDSFNSLV